MLANTSNELTGSTIAALTDGRVSQTGASKALRRLVASGLVEARPAGSAILYRLNHDHLAAPAIMELATMTDALIRRLQDLVAGWELQPAAIALFGSSARGDSGPDSDIDLLVVRADNTPAEESTWLDQVDGLSEAVRKWTGNTCEILEYSRSEMASLVASGDGLVDNLRNDAISIVGTEMRTLLRANP